VVWALYEAYQTGLVERGVCDFSDLVLMALQSVTEQPLDEGYTAVIIDEVQDLSCVGLRLMYALVGDAPDGLFLVGDGQQSVYPGGFTLAEAGVSVPGPRSMILRRNYRNASAIIKAALELVSGDAFDDLDANRESGQRNVEVDREGGCVLRVAAADEESLSAAMGSAISWAITAGFRNGDMAVLVPTNRLTEYWRDQLNAQGIQAQLLRVYEGIGSTAVKVGTYQRAKGLEFSCVFLPDYDVAVPLQHVGEPDDAFRERGELQRRQLFVAMTRARERLWLGRRVALSAAIDQ
jgi:superfamily I DNA/RNA helicase